MKALTVLALTSSLFFPLTLPAFSQSPAVIAAPPPALTFIPVTPCRVADTRTDSVYSGPIMAAGESRNFYPTAGACNIPASASAYSLNVTVVPRHGLSYLTIWPAGADQPLVSTMNSDGRVKANAAIVGAGTNGAISIYVTDTTDVIIDINGYFVPVLSLGALSYYSIGNPCRLVDTRTAASSLGGPYLNAGQTRTFPLQSGACGLPAGAGAYALNVTAISHSWLGFLTVWATGTNMPATSTLNSDTGAVTANAAIVQPDSNGNINVYASNDTDLVIDISGYFSQTGGSTPLSLYMLTPCRMLDTRTMNSPLTPGINLTEFGAIPQVTGGNTYAINSCGAANTAAQSYVLNVTVVPNSSLGYLTVFPATLAPPLASTLNASDAAITSNMAIVQSATDATFSMYASSPTNLIVDISGYFAP